MPFVKFEVDQPSRPDVKVTNTTIVVGGNTWSSVGLDGTDQVNLFWDNQSHQIAISSTTADDRSKFNARKTARGISIPAKKFFAKFGISGAQAEGTLREIGNMIAFKVNLPNRPAAATSSTDAPKRRGRRPKNYAG